MLACSGARIDAGASRDHLRPHVCASHEQGVPFFLGKLEAPPRLNRGWRFCRQGGDVYLVDSSCLLAGPTLPFSLVFGRYCSQLFPSSESASSAHPGISRPECRKAQPRTGSPDPIVRAALIHEAPALAMAPRAGSAHSDRHLRTALAACSHRGDLMPDLPGLNGSCHAGAFGYPLALERTRNERT